MQINRKVRPEIMDSVALLVLDAQDCFIDTLHNKEAFLKRCAFAIEAARCLRLHTIFTEQAPEKLGRTNKELYRLALNPRIFAKQTFSALGAPGLDRYLREKEIYHLLVVGLEVPICVYQTALQATEEDVDVTFLVDALGSRRAQDERPVLDAIARLGCQALPSETVFYSLLGDVQNPYFRAFNQIVKAFNEPDFDLDAYLKDRPQPEETRPDTAEPQQRENRGQRPQRQSREERGEQREPREQRSEKPRQDNRGNRDQSFREPTFEPDGDEAEFDDERDELDERPEAADDAEVAENEDAPASGQSEGEQGERRRRRRRRRGRGRDRDREGSGDPRPPHGERPARTEPKSESKPEPRPESKPEPKPEPKPAAAAEPRPEAPSAPTEAPAKKAAKKATKRATKKTARKAAKKTAAKADAPAPKPSTDE